MEAPPGGSAGRPQLVGRTRELATVDALLEAVRRGLSATLVIRGEAGLGKTALLDYAISTAGDFRVVKAIGIESETNVGFAGLHQLLVPFLPRLERLPPPQRNALGVAFGLAMGPTPERFQVGLATLTLLAVAADEQPLLGIVDDAQWLDVESAQVLGFVARRLQAEGVALLFAIREPLERPIDFGGISEMRLPPLDAGPARQLLAVVHAKGLDDAEAQRLLEESEGNPLAILELTTEPVRGWLGRPPAMSEPLPIGERLQRHFLRRVNDLSPPSQTFLRLASAEPSGDAVVLWRAAGELGLDKEAVAEAEAQQLIVMGPPLSFRHPLIRSAIYYTMLPAERRRMHAVLANATDRRFEPERHAGHRALAAVEPDEEVAAELADQAERAQQRGAHAAWAMFASRAADLTPDPALRASRLLIAARAWIAAGSPDKAENALNEARPVLSDPYQRALSRALEGGIRFAAGQPGDAPGILLRAARAMAPLDAQGSRRILIRALEAAAYSQPSVAAPVMQGIAQVALAPASPAESPETAGELILRGYATVITSGYRAGAPILKEAIAATLREGPAPEALHSLPTLAALSLFDDTSAHALATDWVRVCRERAALTALPVALQLLAIAELHAGRQEEAEALSKQSLETAEATGNLGFLGSARGTVLVIAWRGDEAEARELAAKHVAAARAHDEPFWANFSGYALSIVELALGRYQAALDAALPTYKDDPPWTGSWVTPTLIEAAARVGNLSTAQDGLRRLTERAEAGGTPLGIGLLARCRAILADDSGAEAFYREAIDQLGQSPTRPELARTHLLYGEWLRRQNRRREARDHLRTAYETFIAMGINGFAARARGELLATGEHVRRRTIETQDQLSPQELQVARLAARGVRNQQIASELFISERTVEYHLGKVFRKLDVSSRTQLAHSPQVVGGPPAR
ncbi:MAG TPA: LuxR C-terminal-related transcriptional regulator [Candidatus Dormibacteraeota bacterium]